MPRKSLDIRFSEYPIQQKRANCALFLPSGEDGCGQRPETGQGTRPLLVLRAAPCAPGGFSVRYICNFQGSSEPIFLRLFFHRSLDTTFLRNDFIIFNKCLNSSSFKIAIYAYFILTSVICHCSQLFYL